MKFENKECIDQGSEYCPCHLFETGDCIICTPPNEEKGCNCTNWKGVCIYQEYIWNGNKPKECRKSYTVEIASKENYLGGINVFTLKVPMKLAAELVYPGSYLFIKADSSLPYYDMPISIMDSDSQLGEIKVAIEKRGIKSKSFSKLELGNKVSIRAPFWNGILGLKKIYNVKNSKVIIIVRGMGTAPSIPVIKKLYENGNKVELLLDDGGKDISFIDPYINEFSIETFKLSTLSSGQLSQEAKSFLMHEKGKGGVELIHCDGPDILIYDVLNYLDEMKYEVPVSCCNNIKMCCGEGICGACTLRYKNHNIKRLCKMQIDPKNLFKDRRLI